jgi:hypothetical protein
MSVYTIAGGPLTSCFNGCSRAVGTESMQYRTHASIFLAAAYHIFVSIVIYFWFMESV